jgi:hypothetical protein
MLSASAWKWQCAYTLLPTASYASITTQNLKLSLSFNIFLGWWYYQYCQPLSVATRCCHTNSSNCAVVGVSLVLLPIYRHQWHHDHRLHRYCCVCVCMYVQLKWDTYTRPTTVANSIGWSATVVFKALLWCRQLIAAKCRAVRKRCKVGVSLCAHTVTALRFGLLWHVAIATTNIRCASYYCTYLNAVLWIAPSLISVASSFSLIVWYSQVSPCIKE